MTVIQNILVPVDFTQSSLYAARYAASLAQKHNARLYVLHVKEPFPVHGRIVAGSLEDVQKHFMIKERTDLTKVIPTAFKNSIPVEEIQVTGIPVYRVIVEKAKQFSVEGQTVERGCHRARFSRPQRLGAFFQKKRNRTSHPQCSLFGVCDPATEG
jgi:nucleotide-binding universal stress UspA family protein